MDQNRDKEATEKIQKKMYTERTFEFSHSNSYSHSHSLSHSDGYSQQR